MNIIKKIKNKKGNSLLKKVIYLLIFAILVGTICFFIGRQIGLNTDTSNTVTTVTEETVEKHTITKTLSASGEITTALSKNISLTENYYFKKIYVEVGDQIEKGDKILQYTNGSYLKAPYDLVITEINVPSTGEIVTSDNYIGVNKTSDLIIELSINESEISNVHEGDSVDIVLSSDETKKYSGTISKINAIGNYSSSGSTFTVEVELENDGTIKLGMGVSCTINIETKEDTIAVPVDAVNIDGDNRYVVVVEGKKTKNVTVKTGISDGDYVEITSGLTGGETIQITTTTTESTIRSDSSSSQMGGFGGGGEMPSGGNFDHSNMPSFKDGNNGGNGAPTNKTE